MTDVQAKKPGWLTLCIILLVTLGGGAAISLLTRSSMDIYGQLNKPVFAPAPLVFPIAWGILYAAMSVSLWLLLRTGRPVISQLVLYFVQLAVNFIWPVLFFVQRAYGLAFWWLVLLLALVLWLTARAFAFSKAAGWLLVPYAAWVSFAAALNFFVARLNP